MNKIRELNDKFRAGLLKGQIMLTQGIRTKSFSDISEIINKVRTYNNFNSNNDIYREGDFGCFNYNGERIFWKIDYYDQNFQYMSADPANDSITERVMTILLADEY